MQLFIAVKSNGEPNGDRLPAVVDAVRSMLPEGIRVEVLKKLSLVLLSCPDSTDVRSVREKLAGIPYIGAIVENFSLAAPDDIIESPLPLTAAAIGKRR